MGNCLLFNTHDHFVLDECNTILGIVTFILTFMEKRIKFFRFSQPVLVMTNFYILPLLRIIGGQKFSFLSNDDTDLDEILQN